MPPTLLAQAAVDLGTPFTLAVVVLMLGLAFAYGMTQSQVNTLKEKVDALDGRMVKREEHGGHVDKTLATMEATLKKVDSNVEELLGRRRASSS